MIYSLSSYILTVAIPSGFASQFGADTISVGGEGSYLDNMSVSTKDIWSMTTDATGGYVHEKSLDRSGTMSVTLNQMSDKVNLFRTLCNLYYNSSIEDAGLTLTLTDSNNEVIVTMEDCVISKIPDLDLGETSATQEWSFNCGKIIYN